MGNKLGSTQHTHWFFAHDIQAEWAIRTTGMGLHIWAYTPHTVVCTQQAGSGIHTPDTELHTTGMGLHTHGPSQHRHGTIHTWAITPQAWDY